MKKFNFIPTRAAGLERLKIFLPSAGKDYAASRNYDLGHNNHTNVSMLSPYIRHRSLTEIEVLKSVLCYHSRKSSEKFIQEVFWRIYWKGWLEHRPTVWDEFIKFDKKQIVTTKCSHTFHEKCLQKWLRLK